MKTACTIVIGNEVLSGRTRDANVQFLGDALNKLGVKLLEARVIPDDETVIVDTLNHTRNRFDYVFTTGGIGPTHDDITAACVAKAFGVPLLRDPRAVELLNQHYKAEDLNEARLSMADIPQGAALIRNPVSKAPGFQIGNVFVLAGVPRIAAAMFEDLKNRLASGPPKLSHTLTSLVHEGELAQGLGRIQKDYPDVEIGSYPFFRHGNLGVSVVLRAYDKATLEKAVEDVESAMRALGGEPLSAPPE